MDRRGEDVPLTPGRAADRGGAGVAGFERVGDGRGPEIVVPVVPLPVGAGGQVAPERLLDVELGAVLGRGVVPPRARHAVAVGRVDADVRFGLSPARRGDLHMTGQRVVVRGDVRVPVVDGDRVRVLDHVFVVVLDILHDPRQLGGPGVGGECVAHAGFKVEDDVQPMSRRRAKGAAPGEGQPPQQTMARPTRRHSDSIGTQWHSFFS